MDVCLLLLLLHVKVTHLAGVVSHCHAQSDGDDQDVRKDDGRIHGKPLHRLVDGKANRQPVRLKASF